MPLFRMIAAPAHLTDATFEFDANPDPERWESAESKKPTKTAPAETPATEE